MVKLNPSDISNYLAFRADTDFNSILFKECLFNASTNELISTFLFEERIKNKISAMKASLEQEFKAAVGIPELKYLFLYKQCYMDEERLRLLTTEFLRKNFSFLTLDLDDGDLLVSSGEKGFTVRLRLSKQTADYIKGTKAFNTFINELNENNFSIFNIVFEEKPNVNQKELTLEDIERFAETKLAASKEDKINKVCKVTEREYLLGAPIKERPIKIEFLKVAPYEQIIAGTISFFTKREFIKKKMVTNENGDEVATEKPMPYWTFVLDDGNRKQSCVYFVFGRTDEVLQKNIQKIETLGNGKTICVIGINEERNGRVNFNVRGISTCELD